jgi:hypothetical protein
MTLEPPYSTSGSDTDACIRFYDTACLHGLEVNDPGPTAVSQCVAAINRACTVVAQPQTDPACAWLAPPASSSEASAPQDAATDSE